MLLNDALGVFVKRLDGRGGVEDGFQQRERTIKIQVGIGGGEGVGEFFSEAAVVVLAAAGGVDDDAVVAGEGGEKGAAGGEEVENDQAAGKWLQQGFHRLRVDIGAAQVEVGGATVVAAVADPNEPEIPAVFGKSGDELLKRGAISLGGCVAEADRFHLHLSLACDRFPGFGLALEFQLVGRVAGLADDDQHGAGFRGGDEACQGPCGD